MAGDAVIKNTFRLLDSLTSRDLGVLGFRVTAGPALIISRFATGDLSPVLGAMVHNFLCLGGVLTTLGLLFEFASVLVGSCMLALCYFQFDSSSPFNIVKIGDEGNAATFAGPLVYFSLFLYIGRRGAGRLSVDAAVTAFMASRPNPKAMPWEAGSQLWDAKRVQECSKEEANLLVQKLEELQKENEKSAAARRKSAAKGGKKKAGEDAAPEDCASRLGDKKSK